MRGRYFNHHWNFPYAWQQDQSKPTMGAVHRAFRAGVLGAQPVYSPVAGTPKILHKGNPLRKGNITWSPGFGFLLISFLFSLMPKTVW